MRALVSTTVAAARLLARDGRIPKPLRALVIVGLLPIPGPFDETLLLIALPLVFLFARGPMREAWRRAKAEGGGKHAAPAGERAGGR